MHHLTEFLGYLFCEFAFRWWDCTSLSELEVAKLQAFLKVAAARRGA